jgi:hypothetical protein
MDIQKKALQIIYDITGIILKWDKQELSDKDAMREIVKTLASEVEKDKRFNDENRQFHALRMEKRILAPLAITAVFFGVLFVANPFALDDETIITEDAEIRFEQLNEIPSKIDEMPKNSAIEQFDNQTISNQN